MAKIERKYLAHFINAAALGSNQAEYERLGKDLEEFSAELSAQVDTKKNILGETAVLISGYEKTGELTFGGQTFLAYGIPAENLSGCMTILNDHLLTFIYSPQSDSEYMLQAAEIMDTFKLY